jgi:hypothetical protein
MATYRITSPLLASLQDCPPSLALLVFPSLGSEGWECSLAGEVCTVTAPTPQTPADLGPLVKVELVTAD